MRRIAVLALSGLCGCVSPVEFDSAVLEYDRAVNRVTDVSATPTPVISIPK